MVISNFSNSCAMRDKALQVIPLGAHTFTRSYTQFPYNYSPLFVKKAKGSHFWDVDGNEYVDLLSGLLSVVLGYQDPDVDDAIKTQLQSGITFSLSSELELELAEVLVDLIPSAEMVRFGKNGSDCTSAAMRLARHCTKRDRIAVCGYHGWHDWYVGTTTLNSGVPSAVMELTHPFTYNNIQSLEEIFKKYPNQIAAIIMEPMSVEEPKNNFLQEVRSLADKYGALLVFDEVITGFRFDLGGAQNLFKVTPDLSVFGKAMANGMPLSALVGKKQYMKELGNVFFSSTFAAESLSLSASIATINKLKQRGVIEKIWRYAEDLNQSIQAILSEYKLENTIRLKGLTPWTVVNFSDHSTASASVIRTFWQKEMIIHGVFVLTSHNLNYAHNETDKMHILKAYSKTCEKISFLLEKGHLEKELGTESIQPVFSVRKY